MLVDAIEVRVLLVHHGDDEENGVASLHRLAEHPLCSDFDAAIRADDAQGTVGRCQSRHRITLKVEESGRVDKVDLRPQPLGVRDAEVDGVTALDLFGRRVSEGRPVFHRTVTLAGT